MNEMPRNHDRELRRLTAERAWPVRDTDPNVRRPPQLR